MTEVLLAICGSITPGLLLLEGHRSEGHQVGPVSGSHTRPPCDHKRKRNDYSLFIDVNAVRSVRPFGNQFHHLLDLIRQGCDVEYGLHLYPVSLPCALKCYNTSLWLVLRVIINAALMMSNNRPVAVLRNHNCSSVPL